MRSSDGCRLARSVSESFRPHESSSIDEDLRVRMEGAIELVEDALPLLDSLMYLLARADASRDDVATLQECLIQLPRIDKAIERLERHPRAAELVRALGERKHAAQIAVNERLAALGQPAPASFPAAISTLLDLLRRQGIAPMLAERVLMKSHPAPWRLALLIFCGASAPLVILGNHPLFGLLYGVLLAGSWVWWRRRKPWMLMADRLFFPSSWPKLPRELSPESIRHLSFEGEMVTAKLANETLKLLSSTPKELVSVLHLLRGVWLSGLRSPARPFVLVDGIEQGGNEAGRALISAEGLLFVATSRRALLVKALTREALPTAPSLDQVLELIAHLPEGRWAAMGEHLEQSADACWFPRGGLSLEGEPQRLGATLRHRERVVRVTFSRDEKRLEAEALLGRPRGL